MKRLNASNDKWYDDIVSDETVYDEDIVVNEKNPTSLLIEGVNKIADTVKVTLGAKGKNVLFNDMITQKPRITKDGVTVAKQVYSDNPIERMAIEIIREAAEKTVKTSGDGTTTTVVLAQYIVNAGFNLMKSGVSYYDIAKQLDVVKDEIIKKIKESSLSIEDNFEKLLHVATVSSTSNEIGEFIFNIIKEIGVYGSIEVKSSNAVKDRIDTVKGIKFNKGFYAGQFVNDVHKMQWRHSSGVYIVLFDGTLRTFGDMKPYLSAVNGAEHDPNIFDKNNPILFVCDAVEPTLLQTLVNTKIMNPSDFNIMIVEHDGFGDRKTEIMTDIAAMTSASIGTVDNLGDIGFATEVIVDEDTTSILGGNHNENIVKALIELTKSKLEDEDADDDDIKYYKRRLATLAGGVSIINVGAATEVEMKEKKDRIDDAVEAVKAAIDRGISIGGGYTFIHIGSSLDKKFTDPISQILINALLEPFVQLCKNADVNPEEKITNMVDNDKVGYDVINDEFLPLDEYKVYDPTGVLIDALMNSVAVAKSILSIERAIYNN